MSNPLNGIKFFVDPESPALQHDWLRMISSRSRGYWFANQYGVEGVRDRVRALLERHGDCTAVLVLYNIPNRDLGGFSRGGARNAKEYLRYVDEFVAGIGDKAPIVILEPDALAGAQNMDPNGRWMRLELIRQAIRRLEETKAFVYIDAGNPEYFIEPETAAEYLDSVWVQSTNGFALNVSNFYHPEECLKYGDQINDGLENLGQKRSHFVVDTGRSGVGNISKDDWCNPPGRRLGPEPAVFQSEVYPECDAFLWIKPPGESDGEGNGGPAAGVFWPEYALKLCGYDNE